MTDYIRDAPLGQLIRLLTGNQYLQYPEELADFLYIEKKVSSPSTDNSSQVQSRDEIDLGTQEKDVETQKPVNALSPQSPGKDPAPQHLRRTLSQTETTVNTSISPNQKLILVDWYDSDDAENPQNWPSAKKAWVTFVIW